MLVAPARERGLKLNGRADDAEGMFGRSREGAWIEIQIKTPEKKFFIVAPARERGLKSSLATAGGFLLRSLPRGSVD